MTDSDPSAEAWSDEEVEVAAGGPSLSGTLTTSPEASGIVVFAHGSGSSRHSPRNRYVADRLNRSGFGTLLFDLLTGREATDRTHVFDIELLADRLVAVVGWVEPRLVATQTIGLFGASTGAAAALVAAAQLGAGVGAVVSRGGRPDLAGDALGKVAAPTLLLVGELDRAVLDLNRWAWERITCERRLEIVAGASHLFEEGGDTGGGRRPGGGLVRVASVTGALGLGRGNMKSPTKGIPAPVLTVSGSTVPGLLQSRSQLGNHPAPVLTSSGSSSATLYTSSGRGRAESP